MESDYCTVTALGVIGRNPRGRGRGKRVVPDTVETVERTVNDYLSRRSLFEEDKGGVAAAKPVIAPVENGTKKSDEDDVVQELREFIKKSPRGGSGENVKAHRTVEDKAGSGGGAVITRKIQNGKIGFERTRDSSKGRDGKERKFWLENKMLEVPPIPYESGKVLEEADVQFVADQFWGHDETIENSEEEELPRPVLPQQIFADSVNQRYFVRANEWLQLPLEVPLPTRLLFVDTNDLLYLRYDNPKPSRDERHVETLDKLEERMLAFYSNFQHRSKFSIGKDSWLPIVGEVVIVRLKRYMGTVLSSYNHIQQIQYERAVVLDIQPEGVYVQLIDDYAVGWARYENVFRIVHKFTTLPPQMFVCELADLSFIRHLKVIHEILRKHPIPDIWPDSHMVNVQTTWLGERSEDGRPLIEVMIELRSEPVKQISLKTHVYRNLHKILSPSGNLTKKSTPALCEVVDADQSGFLWVTFSEDKKLYDQIRLVLDQLVPYYHNLLQFLHLTVEMLFPKDEPERFKRNKTRVYATLLSGFSNEEDKDGSKKLYRVMIKRANRVTNKIKVYCIDHHVMKEVNSWELVPLYNLYPDISYFPPAVFRVHLRSIKELQKDQPGVKDALYGEELEIRLEREYPKLSGYPPEVSVAVRTDPLKQDEDEYNSVNEDCTNFFISKGWATVMGLEETIALESLIKIQVVEALKTEVKKETYVDCLESEEQKRKRKEFLAKRAFMGESYQFNWDRRHQRTFASISSRSNSTASSLSSNNISQ